MMERPLVKLSSWGLKSDDASIYANRVGLVLIRNAIDRMLMLLDTSAQTEWERIAVHCNHDWHWLTIHLASHADFDCGGTPCKCGCQRAFAEIEKQHQ